MPISFANKCDTHIHLYWSQLCLRLIGKLGGKNRLFLREILAQNCEGNESIAPRQLSLGCEWQSLSQQSDLMSDDEPKVCSSSFLLPLPLDRAVDVLRLVAESPNIVKKGEKSDVQTTPTLIVSNSSFISLPLGDGQRI